ncbi:LysR family transcriptional regulator [Rhizobium puerariae]|uniref:LysR family transcriptional regulator n=1 Tax=Rhizobium puerariae TaxID=1585791 RepID=A0ABV6AE16_9HYPH
MALPLESDLLRSFLVVAEVRNVTRAALRLGRTQSAVSMQVKRLEEVVGKPLFERGPRGVHLTEEGLRLEPYARRIVGLVDETTALMQTTPLDGTLRIGIPEEYSQTILPHALSAFAERHPATEVTVECGYSSQQLQALENGELDLAIIFDWNNDKSGEVLAIDPTVWVASTAHEVHLQRPLPIAVYRRSDWCREFAIRSLERHSIAYRIAFTCETSGALRSAASAGLGVAPLSRSSIPADCRELTQEDGFPPVDFSRVLLKRKAYRSRPAVDALAETIRKAFAPLGWA